jgi:hypothetical protein
MVKLLLKDSRVDPSVENNYAFTSACANGHFSVVKELMNDPRVDINADHKLGLRLARKNKHVQVLGLFGTQEESDDE